LITLTPPQFKLFQAFIHRHTGIWTQDSKVALLSNRIRRRLRERGIEDFDTYYTLLSEAKIPGELGKFIDCITTNETHFFRTSDHFDWFAGPFIDGAMARAAAGHRPLSLRVWSAACSSGEEAYSLAICLAERGTQLANWSLRVVGSDISDTTIARARTAIYGPKAVERVAPDRLAKYFVADPADDTWKVKPAVAGLCEFRRHNLLDPMPEPKFDCIFLRNVLIYFDTTSKPMALKHLVNALHSGGFLVVGTTDGAHDFLGSLERCSTFLYRKP
jgi:chemotaxis protein methyltransferase CheR